MPMMRGTAGGIGAIEPARGTNEGAGVAGVLIAVAVGASGAESTGCGAICMHGNVAGCLGEREKHSAKRPTTPGAMRVICGAKGTLVRPPVRPLEATVLQKLPELLVALRLSQFRHVTSTRSQKT